MISSERLVAMFAALDDDGRHFAEMILQNEYDRVQRTRRPVLRVIAGGAAPRLAADGNSRIVSRGGAR